MARDRFWELLLELSRQHGVTIFVSTHFMNEAERCDRISLMHAGRVLAQGDPAELVAAQNAAYPGGGLHRLPGSGGPRVWRGGVRRVEPQQDAAPPAAAQGRAAAAVSASAGCWPTPGARRMELRRDPIRARLRAARARAPDDRHGLRHLLRRRAHPLRRARPGPNPGEPGLPGAVRRPPGTFTSRPPHRR